MGVFVTVHRHKDRLNRWPEDIHGCMGYWDRKYETLKVFVPDDYYMIFKMFCLLQQRFDRGLYKFLNGVGRLDITGHVFAGFRQIIKNSKK